MTTLTAIVDAVAQTGQYLRDHAFDERETEWKKAHDPVTKYDKGAETKLKELLMQSAPGNFIGEEYGEEHNGHQRRYIIDAIDGTKEWVTHGFNCSISLGIEERDKLIGGIVYDFMRDIMYVGYEGTCEMLYNGKSHPFRQEHGLQKTLVSIVRAPHLEPLFPRDEFSVSKKNGSIALSMAELAAGNYDAMIRNSSGKGSIWDVAGGHYLLKAAGCTVLDCKGEPFDYVNCRSGIIGLRPDTKDRVLGIISGPMGLRR